MASWRDPILAKFGPGDGRLILVADPDGLLLDERIFQELSARGFEVVTLEDPIAFRHLYESRYRVRWDRGEETDRRLVVRAPEGDLAKLPYDLTRVGRELTFGLPQLFPELSYPVLAALDRGDLDRLWAVRGTFAGSALGDRPTRDLVLLRVYDVDLNRIRNASDLLGLLLKRHRSGRALPPMLEARLLAKLRERAEFSDWPLDQILPRRDAFLGFLQERWPTFLQQIDPGRPITVGEPKNTYAYAYGGPAEIAFDDGDVRAEIQALFLDGALKPIQHSGQIRPSDEWVSVGIRRDPELDRIRRLTLLAERLAVELPSSDARYGDWIDFAYRWGELTVLASAGSALAAGNLLAELQRLREAVDSRFFAWATDRYGGLYSQPPLPVMVSHIPRALAAFRSQGGGKKVALVVVDGMAIDGWVVLRERLRVSRPDLRFDESGAFAWVPTITPVSRQAMFAGQLPSSFPTTLDRTDRDAMRWKAFWTNRKLADDQIGYLLLPHGIAGELALVDGALSIARLQVLGIVVGTVDGLAHGSKLGKAGLHNQIRLWVDRGFVASLLDRLFDAGFSVVLTSDHGNVEAIGTGSVPAGSLASTRGERARVYPSDTLRDSANAKSPEAIPWPPLGLPDRYFPLLAPGRAAFVPIGEQIVTHGGLSLEEVVVPYVVVRRGQS